ncbi:MAG: peptidoglycan-binding protein, partial [Firmicutes bacterium]|nr:peptidoglycan-binding protein [Bacillota bacterium]
MYHFFIDGVLLPVPPSKLSIKIKNKNQTVTLADGSEYNLLKSAGLSEINFDCLLPNRDYPFAVYENAFLSADYYLALFERLKSGQRVFTFCVERGEFARSFFSCALEDYTISESTNEA